MGKTYFGFCFKCKRYEQITFRCTKSEIDEETGEVIKKGKRFPICLGCLGK